MADTVVVGMSGGVDSSVAAALLKEQGYDVIGVTLNLWPGEPLVEADTRRSVCCSLDSVEDARRVADRLGFPHYTLNFRDLFDEAVVRNFVGEYSRGRTPNPCVRCNRFLKFGALLNRARALGARYVATGHYARVEHRVDGRSLLRKARDLSKDQSYALYSLTQDQLGSALFPLGELSKPETRRIAAELGLVTAERPESQELCFVPNDDYPGYMRRNVPSSARPGPIKDLEGRKLGTHPGIAFYTVGQRKGLGLAVARPLYVLKIVPEENAVVVGEEERLYSRGLVAEEVNWVSQEEPVGPISVGAKIRYRSREAAAVARVREDGALVVEFAEPQRAISPGQAVVLYDGDLVVGGGVISRQLSAVSNQLSAVSD